MLYRNAFATDLALGDGNVAEVAEAGRSHWKIENENNNTLMTKGYHFEHNYGHGKQYLSSLLASLIILASLVHTVLDRASVGFRRFPRCRFRVKGNRLPSSHDRLSPVLIAGWDGAATYNRQNENCCMKLNVIDRIYGKDVSLLICSQ